MDYKISVLIRTYNEEKHLGEVLESLKNQTYQNFETIILDSESTDRTLQIVKEYEVRIEHIRKKDFNYSYASNKLVEYAAGDIVCFLSGHSVPVKNTYLSDLNEVFQNQRVGGCYGDVVALPDASLSERLFHGLGYLKNKLKNQAVTTVLETKIHPGIFSCCNAAARRELLLKHPFAIALGSGGEDIEVAYRLIQDGYFIAFVPDLVVMHSHGKPLIPFIREYISWREMWKKVLAYIEQNEHGGSS